MQKATHGGEAIELRGLCKSFGPVRANQNIDLTVRTGEILALLGENGSGKTTLMNMLSGLYHPDAGTIAINGRQVRIHSPHDALKLGIGMIHQHFKLVDVLSVQDNIVLGTGTDRGSSEKRAARIREISNRFGLSIDPLRKVYTLSVSEKQTVEILKVLYRGSNILILDEPTAVLTPQEIDKLFIILRKMKAEGCAVIIITHKLNEVLAISDRVSILHRGQCVATVSTDASSARDLTELMVGHSVDLSIDRPTSPNVRPALLKVDNLTVYNSDKVKVLDAVSFCLSGGEILGVAGVAGSGQKELCETITGLMRADSGVIEHQETDISAMSARQIQERGIHMSFVPEDRLGMGLVGSMGMVDNMLLKSYQEQAGFGLKRAGAKDRSEHMVEKLSISTPSVYTPVKQLSGGNVQKVLLGREIDAEPDVLITAYPVRGLDINSSMTIYRLLNEQKLGGTGVLFIGEDLDVLMELCDRILILCGGRVTGIIHAGEATKEQIGLMMTGYTMDSKEVGLRHE